jgi:phosphate transport system substrate-binding protein
MLGVEPTCLNQDGSVAVVGYNDMEELLCEWSRRFRDQHPDVRFSFDLSGTRFAPEALASGRSAFAPMGGEFTPPQRRLYGKLAGARSSPVPFEVAHASVNPRALSGPIGIFVHHKNPMVSLDLVALRRALAGEVATWGEVGAEGAWASQPIHLVGVRPDAVIGLFVQDRVLMGAPYAAVLHPVGQSSEVVDLVGEDPLALGYAAAMRATPMVRALALAPTPSSPPVAPTVENVGAGRYPLDRFLLIYVRSPVSALAREFMELVLSPAGQQVVNASGLGYLPLTIREAASELCRLRRLPPWSGPGNRQWRAPDSTTTRMKRAQPIPLPEADH